MYDAEEFKNQLINSTKSNGDNPVWVRYWIENEWCIFREKQGEQVILVSKE